MMAAGLAVGVSTAASAAPTIFTWSPSGASPPLVGGDVTADNITVADFASATINPVNGDFTEVGALKVSSFQLGGSGATATGLNSTYSLYVMYTASGNQGGPIPTPGHTTSGPITSLSYTLFAVPNGSPPLAFTVTDGNVAVSGNAGQFALASGSGGGTLSDFVTLTNTGGTPNVFIPSAQARTSFNIAPGEQGFFVSPPPSIVLDLEAAFTNTAGVSTLSSCDFNTALQCLNIVGGGGNLDLSVVATPEPTTLAVLGVGLLGLGMLRRKQKSVV
jgi:hypothetical protein